MSENIKVRSVIGRFLEHSRVYSFANGQADQSAGDFFIGSADWMSRNLNNRVETIAPILDPAIKQELWQVLDLYLQDKAGSWMLQPEGQYLRGAEPGAQGHVQELLMQRFRERHRASA